MVRSVVEEDHSFRIRKLVANLAFSPASELGRDLLIAKVAARCAQAEAELLEYVFEVHRALGPTGRSPCPDVLEQRAYQTYDTLAASLRNWAGLGAPARQAVERNYRRMLAGLVIHRSGRGPADASLSSLD